MTKAPSMIEDLYTLFRFASTLAVFWPRLLEHRRAERAPAGPSSVCQQWDLERTIKGLRRYGLSASHFVMTTSKRQFWVAYTSMPIHQCPHGPWRWPLAAPCLKLTGRLDVATFLGEGIPVRAARLRRERQQPSRQSDGRSIEAVCIHLHTEAHVSVAKSTRQLTYAPCG